MTEDKPQTDVGKLPNAADRQVEDIPLSAEQEDQIKGGLISQKGALISLGG